MAIENLLARLTAQTTHPRHGQGGAPEFTADDISKALGQVGDEVGYHAVQAAFLDDINSTRWLQRHLQVFGWCLWLENRNPHPIAVPQHEQIVGIVLQAYLDPQSYEKTSVEKIAKRLQVSVKTWKERYDKHHRDLHASLHAHQENALSDVRYYLFG